VASVASRRDAAYRRRTLGRSSSLPATARRAPGPDVRELPVPPLSARSR